jgi:hypothetical protein
MSIRNPKILKVSNLPNNIFYNKNTKFLQGYLEDEGVYNIKIFLEENGEICEKILRINVFKKYKKYIYPINYPINLGFIKYNPQERLGILPKIEIYQDLFFGNILRHSTLGTIYTFSKDINNQISMNINKDFSLIFSDKIIDKDVGTNINLSLKYSSFLQKKYLIINDYPIYIYNKDKNMYSIDGIGLRGWGLFRENGQRVF